MSKSPDAFRTISEVADWLDTPAHVLRFWESKFSQVKPIKRAGGRRYYRPADMLLLGGIKQLLHQDGLTIKEVQLLLREKGPKHVGSLSSREVDDDDTVTGVVIEDTTQSPAQPSEPMFSSVSPRIEITLDEDEKDDNQMSFPGFEFASDRAKTFESPKPVDPVQTGPQPIDISHIPELELAGIDAEPKGTLSRLASLTKISIAAKSKEIASIRQQFLKISTSRAHSSES